MVRLPDLSPLGKTKHRLNHSYADLHALGRRNSVFDKLRRRFSQSERDISSLGLNVSPDLTTPGPCEGDSFIVYNMMTATSDCQNPTCSIGESVPGLRGPVRRSSSTFDGFSDIIDIIQGKAATMNLGQSIESDGMQGKEDCLCRNGFLDNEVVIANKTSENQIDSCSCVFERVAMTGGKTNLNIASEPSNYIKSNGTCIEKAVNSSVDFNGVRIALQDGACESVLNSSLVDCEVGLQLNRSMACDDIQHEPSPACAFGRHNGVQRLEELEDVYHDNNTHSQVVLKFSETASSDKSEEESSALMKSTADYSMVDKSLDKCGLCEKCASGEVCLDYRQAGEDGSVCFSEITNRFDNTNVDLKSEEDYHKSNGNECKKVDKADRKKLAKHNTEHAELHKRSSHDNMCINFGLQGEADVPVFMRKSLKDMDSSKRLVNGEPSSSSSKALPLCETPRRMSLDLKSLQGKHNHCLIDSQKTTYAPESVCQEAGGGTTGKKSSSRRRSLSDENILSRGTGLTGRTRRLFSAPDLLRAESKEKECLDRNAMERGSRTRSLKSALRRRTSEPSGSTLRVRFDLSGSGKSKTEPENGSRYIKEASGNECSTPKKNWRYVIKKFRIKQPLGDFGLLRGNSAAEKSHGKEEERVGYSKECRNTNGAHRTEISLESVKEFNMVLPFASQRIVAKDMPTRSATKEDAKKVADVMCGNPVCRSVERREADGHSTPLLHVAASDGNVELLKRLVDVGVDLNAKDSNGWPALHYAILQGHFECAALLLDSGVDVNCYTDDIIKDYCKAIRQVIVHKQLISNKSQ